VAVLKKSRDGKVYAVTDLPSVAGMQVEQLLTSEHFGLSSTTDPALEAAFDRYYELLRLKRPGKDDLTEIAELRAFLAQLRVLGATRRERLMLEAIDRWLARDETGPADRQAARDSLDSDLDGIMSEAEV
jgi:hypothetical protein